MAQVTTPHETRRIVDARTIQPPHRKCGTNSKTSTRNASRVTRRVGRSRIKRASKKRGECDGPWKCAAPARQRQTRVRKAATGWTIRMDESDFRVLEGRLKSPPVLSILSAEKI